MNKGLNLLIVVLMMGSMGCTPKKQQDSGSLMASQQVISFDGALVSEDFEVSDDNIIEVREISSAQLIKNQKPVIVQCPACNQRVDVSDLPREQIICPNCNSLFTY